MNRFLTSILASLMLVSICSADSDDKLIDGKIVNAGSTALAASAANTVTIGTLQTTQATQQATIDTAVQQDGSVPMIAAFDFGGQNGTNLAAIKIIEGSSLLINNAESSMGLYLYDDDSGLFPNQVRVRYGNGGQFIVQDQSATPMLTVSSNGTVIGNGGYITNFVQQGTFTTNAPGAGHVAKYNATAGEWYAAADGGAIAVVTNTTTIQFNQDIKLSGADVKIDIEDRGYLGEFEDDLIIVGPSNNLSIVMQAEGINTLTGTGLKPWWSAGTATTGQEIVNYQTMTGDGSTKILDMDDAAGTNTKWTEWAIGGTQDTDDNWRMGVVNSNFTIQVRVSGTWTNATSFTRP